MEEGNKEEENRGKMKRKLIEWLIRQWFPKYHLARIRGPYIKKIDQNRL